MQVVIAQAMGMCFGVRDALAAAEQVDLPEEVSVFGELVHNPEVLARLTVRGMEVMPEHARGLPGRGRVLITAHGISDAQRAALLAAGKALIDTTCPLVRRAHAAARELAREGRLVVVIGQAGHVEVKGLVEDLPKWLVVNSCAEVKRWEEGRIGVMCQTTTPTEHAQEILAAVWRENPQAQIRFVDTICQPTKDRQRALEELLGRVDAVVVVGARHSNNTRKLMERCVEHGVRSLHVQGVEELRAEWFEGIRVVGLTAGTSALGETVEEVRRWLEGIGNLVRQTNLTTEFTEGTETQRV